MAAFVLLAVIIAALVAISCIPGAEYLYSSLPMILLWGALAVSSAWYIVRRRLYRRGVLFLLHISLLVILTGAVVTHFAGHTDTISVRTGGTVRAGELNITLNDFSIIYYPGTSAPQDFVSELEINGEEQTVSMNNVASVGGYRIFQTSYDADLGGSTLTVTYDPAGTAVTYFGYGLLFLSMVLWLIVRSKGHRTIAAAMIVFSSAAVSAAEPDVLPAEVAEEFGELSVYHNGRIAPLSTLAGDFTRKLTGASGYHGLSDEQVLTGWLFYYDSWKAEPCIAIKDKPTRRELGAGKVALTDFFDAAGYRFENNKHAEANEKFAIASSAATGSIWKIFPYERADGTVEWLSPVDDMPDDMPVEEWHIARHSLNYIARLVDEQNWAEVSKVITQLANFQARQLGPMLPSRWQTVSERLYLKMALSVVPAIVMLLAGLVFLIFRFRRLTFAALIISLAWVASMIAFNWIASGHAPCSNGEETMQLLALCTLTFTLFLRRRSRSVIPLGLIIASLALIVSSIGHRSPQVTQLMPVLNSPLLSIHVLAVMLAYSLLAIMAMSGILWLAGRRDMLPTARTLLCPAVFLLAAGIFIGAIWANQSWGRYWGWDPKEVWALITMLIYSFPLHDQGALKFFRRDKVFAIFCAAAFLSVLMTYFGVNFILGGLHSYS